MIKKFFSSLVLFIFLVLNFNILEVYASSQQELNNEKQNTEKKLDKLELVVDKTVDKLWTKIKDNELQEKLEQKHEEIKKYLDEVKTDISDEKSTKMIKEKRVEATKVVVLKVVSAITKDVDIKKDIDNDKTINKDEALKTIKESIDNWSDYNLIIRTKYSKEKTLALFKKFDSTIKVNFLYKQN